MKYFMSKFLIATALIMGFQTNALAKTGEINYNLVNFSTTVSQKVENDEISVVMSKTLQNKSHTEVAKRITETLNQASLIAKKYPLVKILTGNQFAYPQYDKNQKIIGWQGSASLNLQSNDMTTTSQLIAELQSFMQLDDLSFSVSENKQKSVKQALMLEASKSFQQQAVALLPVWQAQSYQLVSLDFNGGDNFASYHKSMGSEMMTVAEQSMPVQDFQAGDTTIQVTVDGVIQLIK